MHFGIIIQAFYFYQTGISAYLPFLPTYVCSSMYNVYTIHEKIIQFEISMSIYILLLIDTINSTILVWRRIFFAR